MVQLMFQKFLQTYELELLQLHRQSQISNILVPKYIINAPIEPITIAKPGVGVNGSAVIATKPAKRTV